jgi:hypothetical protein
MSSRPRIVNCTRKIVGIYISYWTKICRMGTTAWRWRWSVRRIRKPAHLQLVSRLCRSPSVLGAGSLYCLHIHHFCMRACWSPALIAVLFHDQTTPTIFDEDYKLWRLPLCIFLQRAVTFTLLELNFLNTPSQCMFEVLKYWTFASRYGNPINLVFLEVVLLCFPIPYFHVKQKSRILY